MKHRFDVLGINKGVDCASIALVDSKTGDFQIFLRERLSRKKRDGDPFLLTAIELQRRGILAKNRRVAETGFYSDPITFERELNARVSFPDYLRKFGLSDFSRMTGQVDFVTHHRAHALAAAWLSPFKRSIIVVADGLGSNRSDFSDVHPERKQLPQDDLFDDEYHIESMSVYRQNGCEIECVDKVFQYFDKDRGHFKSVSLGTVFEVAAEMIFADRNAAGKVMGLAALGRSQKYASRDQLFFDMRSELSSRAFRGRSLAAWEKSSHQTYYRNLAATVQTCFEQEMNREILRLRKSHPSYRNLILTGGCALNCVYNAKLAQKKWFDRIYTPPFPGDEGVGLGAALAILDLEKKSRIRWRPATHARQSSFYGPERSRISEKEVRSLFKKHHVVRRNENLDTIASVLMNGEVVGVFEGASESGPRALGHRSLLASPLVVGMKDRLNREVKGRESFRPFGVVVIRDLATEYFQIDVSQASPFMDFAPRIRSRWEKKLREVVHVDKTCRIQTLTRHQNPWLYSLLKKFENMTGVGCLINTSLNVMHEPIAESISDMMKFWDLKTVDHLVVDDFFISRRREREGRI